MRILRRSYLQLSGHHILVFHYVSYLSLRRLPGWVDMSHDMAADVDRTAGDERIWNALATVSATELILRLPHGLDTPLDEVRVWIDAQRASGNRSFLASRLCFLTVIYTSRLPLCCSCVGLCSKALPLVSAPLVR